MNAELIRQALEKVGNANTLIHLISRRVRRQLKFGGGGFSRPLVLDTGNLGMVDITLREIIEDKMGWEMPAVVGLKRPVNRHRKLR
jgi:hypothetical protein